MYLLANPRGFCAGVDRAIEIVERALETFGAPIYVRHEVVHNRYRRRQAARTGRGVRRRTRRSARRRDRDLQRARRVAGGARARPARRGLRVFDATCPLVTKVHMEVARHAKAGRDVVLIGHAGHPEVEGTMGQWDRVESGRRNLSGRNARRRRQDWRRVDPDNIAYVDADDAVGRRHQSRDRCAAQRFPAILGPRHDDICYATQNRQDAVRRLGQQCDLVLVVGSPNSSNSNRLRELARKAGRAGVSDRRRRTYRSRVDRRQTAHRRYRRRVGAGKPGARCDRAPARLGCRQRARAGRRSGKRHVRVTQGTAGARARLTSRCPRACRSSAKSYLVRRPGLFRNRRRSSVPAVFPRSNQGERCELRELLGNMRRRAGSACSRSSLSVAVLAILTTLAMPSMLEVGRRMTVTEHTNDLVGALATAKSEAAKLGVIAGVVGSGNNWSLNGWMVQVDSNGDNALTGADTVVASYAGLTNQYTVKTKVTGGADAQVVFGPQGTLALPATQADINVCRPDQSPTQSVVDPCDAPSGEITSRHDTSPVAGPGMLRSPCR